MAAAGVRVVVPAGRPARACEPLAAVEASACDMVLVDFAGLGGVRAAAARVRESVGRVGLFVAVAG
ncbi:hypothetical protein ACPCTG_19490 [Streptomyces pseudogriseolus]|uniref:hypothetical protein n=1 Tax=Streptomyces pseudogriseolus TaxID=36817 RepID=UPI003FA23B4A